MRFLPMRDYQGLKAVSRSLVDAAGGVARAASLTRGAESRMSEACALHVEDRFLAIDQVADLEAECGAPIVSRRLVQMMGLDAQQVASAAPRSLSDHFARVVIDCTDVQRELAAVLSSRILSAPERANLLKEIDEAVGQLQALRQGLMAESFTVVRS